MEYIRVEPRFHMISIKSLSSEEYSCGYLTHGSILCHPREFFSPPPEAATAPLIEGKSARRSSSTSPSKASGQEARGRSPSLGNFPDPSKEGNMGWYCGALYWNCLQYVDAYFDEVIECECVSIRGHTEPLLQKGSLDTAKQLRVAERR